MSRAQAAQYDTRPKGEYRRKHALKDGMQPDLGQSPDLKLMDFQVRLYLSFMMLYPEIHRIQIDGFNWLCNNWFNLQPCVGVSHILFFAWWLSS